MYWETTCIQENKFQNSMNSSSSEEGGVWKLCSGKLYKLNSNQSSNQLKQDAESFSNLDDCIITMSLYVLTL